MLQEISLHPPGHFLTTNARQAQYSTYPHKQNTATDILCGPKQQTTKQEKMNASRSENYLTFWWPVIEVF